MSQSMTGRAANGGTWNGQTIGSGYDCRCVRETAQTVLVRLTNVATGEHLYAEFDRGMRTNLDALAAHVAMTHTPSDGWWLTDDTDAADYDEDALVRIATRWHMAHARVEQGLTIVSVTL